MSCETQKFNSGAVLVGTSGTVGLASNKTYKYDGTTWVSS